MQRKEEGRDSPCAEQCIFHSERWHIASPPPYFSFGSKKTEDSFPFLFWKYTSVPYTVQSPSCNGCLVTAATASLYVSPGCEMLGLTVGTWLQHCLLSTGHHRALLYKVALPAIWTCPPRAPDLRGAGRVSFFCCEGGPCKQEED
jgi:hypothetical protein